MKKVISITERIIFGSRWVLMIMYLRLALDLLVYAIRFIFPSLALPIWLAGEVGDYTYTIIERVDQLMIANLIVMITIGGWQIFLKKIDVPNGSGKPQWLDHINAGGLKVKMSMSLAGVVCVYLLKYFIETDNFYHKIIIAVLYLAAGYIFAQTDDILHPERKLGLENQTNHTDAETKKVKPIKEKNHE